jgi:hypothetical protein
MPLIAARGARENPAKVITACGIQADYVLGQMRQQIARAYPGMGNISEPMRLAQPSGWKTGTKPQ